MSLYRPDTETNVHVSFKILDGEGNQLLSRQGAGCFSDITYSPLDPKARTIVTFHSLEKIPYGTTSIKEWISQINELGFPCSVEIKSECAYFTINLADYERKIHISMTLQLIRALHEKGICYAPSYYLAAIKKGMSLDDRFIELQNAFRNVGVIDKCYYNSNHMPTSRSNGENVSRKELFKRIKANENLVYGPGISWGTLSELWRK